MMKKTGNRRLLMALAVVGICMTACQKRFGLTESSVTLHKDEKYTIGYENGTSLVFTSDNPYVASVDDEGVVTANFVGTANVNVEASEGLEVLKVNVAPLYTVYEEPCLDFTLNRQEIHQIYISSYLGYNKQNVQFYEAGQKKYAYGYKYDDNQKILGVYVFVRAAQLAEMQDFLGERYFYEGKSDDNYMYSNRTDMIVTFTKYENDPNFGFGYRVYYVPIDWSNVVSSNSELFPARESSNSLL